MTSKLITSKISNQEIIKIAEENFGTMVKGVVDIKKKVVALGGELHIDANEILLKTGSDQRNVWGINIYPLKPKESQIEFNSLINIRPLSDNRSMDIESEEIKNKIKEIIYNFVDLDGTAS